MPRNSTGQIAVGVPVVALASYAFSTQDSIAMCFAIPGGGTVLKLPRAEVLSEFYDFADVDGSCSSGSPITVQAASGQTIQGATSVLVTAPFAWGRCVWAGDAWVLESAGATGFGPLTPPANGYWSQSRIFIDPQDVTGTASDANDGKTRETALLTWRRYAQLLGTLSPFLNVDVIVTFLSSHIDDSDPVIWSPFMGNAAFPIIMGDTPTIVASGVVLSNVVPKSRTIGSNAILAANLGGGGVNVNLIVDNTTEGKASRAFVYENAGGDNWQLTQPLTPWDPFTGLVTFPVEVDTWANGDTVTISQPIEINIVNFSPQIVQFASDQTNYPLIYQCAILDPVVKNSTPCIIGQQTMVVECALERWMFYMPSVETLVFNCIHESGFDVNGASVTFIGGGDNSTGDGGSNTVTGPTTFDGDWIFGSAAPYLMAGTGAGVASASLTFGAVYLDQSVFVTMGTLIVSQADMGIGIVYGSAGHSIDMQGSSHLGQTTGASFTATFTAPALVSPGVLVNGAASASSHTGATPDVLSSNITTTPAHLDAAAGAAGFGGNAFKLGGASVGNFA